MNVPKNIPYRNCGRILNLSVDYLRRPRFPRCSYSFWKWILNISLLYLRNASFIQRRKTHFKTHFLDSIVNKVTSSEKRAFVLYYVKFIHTEIGKSNPLHFMEKNQKGFIFGLTTLNFRFSDRNGKVEHTESHLKLPCRGVALVYTSSIISKQAKNKASLDPDVLPGWDPALSSLTPGPDRFTFFLLFFILSKNLCWRSHKPRVDPFTLTLLAEQPCPKRGQFIDAGAPAISLWYPFGREVSKLWTTEMFP